MAKQKLSNDEPVARKEVSDNQRMYDKYVHGTTINDIAAEFKVEVHEVLKVIEAIEAGRVKE